MLPSSLRKVLYGVQAVAGATLVRSVLYERWITVLVASLLLAGVMATQRRKTWGVGASFGAAVWFLAAGALGIGPPWFGLVAIVAALPFMMTWRSLVRFDAGATAVATGLLTMFGAATAVWWHNTAYAIFRALPMLIPSRHMSLGSVGMAALATVALTRVARSSSNVSAGASPGADALYAGDESPRLRAPAVSQRSASGETAPEDEAELLEPAPVRLTSSASRG